MTHRFVSVYDFAKQKKTSPQNIYRHIREQKLPAGMYKTVTVVKKRLYIREDAPLRILKKKKGSLSR